MNILFLTIGRIESIETHSLYPDLLRQFRDHGHQVYVVCPRERRTGKQTELVQEKGACILHVRVGNITKCNLIEKGISTLRLESAYLGAIEKYFAHVKFDLVLYSTPPITFAKVVQHVKKRDGARSYLMLKDIFPQNAVDLGMMSKTGPKSVLYRYFRRKEKLLYRMSDTIGCMSPANVAYVLRHNPELPQEKVELCPNAIDPLPMDFSQEELMEIRDKYGIPQDRTVFVYGGNLGRPQGIPFLMECLQSQKDNQKAFFLIVGSGTEFYKLQQYAENTKQDNFLLLKSLPKDEYDRMICACDVGMIFLDHRFTIPNFPSRLLAYMQARLPVLACTDANTDIGKVIVDGGFGWWCESSKVSQFKELVERICASQCGKHEGAYEYLVKHYSTKQVYRTIIQHGMTKES